MKIRFQVEGMTCAVCSASVEKVVSRLQGVTSARVNLSSKTLVVECEESLKPEEVIRVVNAAGFSATLKESSFAVREENRRQIWMRLLASAVLLAVLMVLSMGHMVGIVLFEGIERTQNPHNHALLQLVLSLVILWINRVFFVRGYKAVLRGGANMDTLVALGSLAAFSYSLWQSVRLWLYGGDLPHLYFESAAMILTLVTFGKLLESRAKEKTQGALVGLLALSVERVCVLREGQTLEVEPSAVQVGDVMLTRPGERIAADGIVTSGESALDTSALTGESLPRDVKEGDSVLSGSMNLSGSLTILVQKRVQDSTLSQMIALVEEAGVTRSPAARLADRLAAIFVPSVSVLAVLCTVIWLLLGESFGVALGFGISVLVISCPCALGLATPVAVTAALGRCASRGILVREAAVFETMADCDTVVLDKTGTLTRGTPEVSEVFALIDEKEFLSLAASLEEGSEHPLARAVCRFVTAERVHVTNFEAVFGLGVKAQYEEQVLLGGNRRFLEEHGVDPSPLSAQTEEAARRGKTVLYFSLAGKLIGALALSDALKETSQAAVSALQTAQKEVLLLTGDSASVAETVAAECGISRILSGVLPAEKEGEISRLRSEGHRVLMAGDGVNDAAALLRSDVAVSLGTATDIAQNAADVLLLSGDLLQIPALFAYCRRVVRIIRQNLFWAFLYNCLAIPVAAGALVPLGITLSPMLAAACMSMSSLFVVTNALRLYRGKENL